MKMVPNSSSNAGYVATMNVTGYRFQNDAWRTVSITWYAKIDDSIITINYIEPVKAIMDAKPLRSSAGKRIKK